MLETKLENSWCKRWFRWFNDCPCATYSRSRSMPFENWHINEYFLVHWRPKFQTLKNCNNFYTLRFWIPLFLQNPLTRVCFICADRAGSFNSCVFEHSNGGKTTRVTDTWGTGILPSPEPKNTFALLPPRSTENRALVSTIITLKNSRKSSLKSCFFLPLLAGLTKVFFVHSIVYMSGPWNA